MTNDVVHEVERCRVIGVGRLDLQLAEDRHDRSGVQDRNRVVHELNAAITAGDIEGLTSGSQGNDGLKSVSEQEWRNDVDELRGDMLRRTEGQPKFVSGACIGTSDRKLHVPPVIGTTGTSPKRDSPAKEGEVGRIEVRRLEGQGALLLDLKIRNGAEFGKLEKGVDSKLALNLAVRLRRCHRCAPALRCAAMSVS
jgi:hypothetical protein